MRRTLILGTGLGLSWGLLETGLARSRGLGLEPSDPVGSIAAHLVLGAALTLAAGALLTLARRARGARAEDACGLAAGLLAAGVSFVRLHFALLAAEPWNSAGHLLALAGSAAAGLAVAWLVRLAAARLAGRVRLETRAGSSAALALLVLALFPAGRSLVQRFDTTGVAGSAASAPPYDVLLITLDTLRRDHLSTYGYALQTDTELRRFGFTRLDGVWAASPWTRPSTASILTGSYPSTHTAVDTDSRLPDAAVTLAELLGERGFATAHCAANLNASDVFGMAQGSQFTIRNPYVVPHPLSGTTLGELLRRRVLQLQDARDLERMARAFLGAAGDSRFFLYLHFEDPHTPYDPPPQQLSRFAPDYRGRVFKKPRPDQHMSQAEVGHMVARYDGDIANATEAVGRVLDLLAGSGRLARTLVILTADHGEAFGDHGRFNHSDSLYEELLSIPLLVRPPDGLPRVPEVEVAASHVDLLPTVLDYLGLPPAPELPGRSLRPWIEGSAPAQEEPRLLLAECHRIDAWSCRLGRWKLIATGPEPVLELYDLESDPRELANLAADPARADIVRELLERGRELREQLAARRLSAQTTERGSEVRGLLNRLGYGGTTTR
jgi:arylsulfatase A-like enzyme